MNREEAKKVLKILATADEGCTFCVRNLFVQFARTFPEFAGLAISSFKEMFGENLLDENKKCEIVKDTINSVLKEHQVCPVKIILFGSRARDVFDEQSDWDILIVTKEKLTRKEKEKIAETIRKALAKFLIPSDVLIKNEDELSFYEKFYGTVTYEALKEGVNL